MQEKVVKLFTYFDDIKHENIFALCVSQLVELYEQCPQSLRIIMYHLRRLLFSTTKDSRLKLKHRQLAASLVGKLAHLYTHNLSQFAHEDATIEMEQFQMDDQQVEEEPKPQVDWSSIAYVAQIEKRVPLVASDRTFKESESDLKRMQSRFFERMKEMQIANETNVNYMLGRFADQHEEEETVEEPKGRRSKLATKMEKLNRKNEERMRQARILTVFNPFNYVYELCMENLLSPLWEMRHLAVLLLRAFQPYLTFIGFRCIVHVDRLPREDLFRAITDSCRQQLIIFLRDKQQVVEHNNHIITNCLFVLALDKFGDMQFDKVNNMIRDVAAEVLAKQYCQLQYTEQVEMLAIVKELLEHHEASKTGREPFSWELRYSFVTLLYSIMEDASQREYIYEMFSDTFLRMLENGQDEDDVVLAICDCYNRLWHEKYFTREYAVRVGHFVWTIVEHIDDITYAAVSILRLLELLVEDFSADELLCLTRIRKFFVNKIREVRRQFYALLSLIYSKLKLKFRDCDAQLPPIIETNIEQYLQAVMIEEDQSILSELAALGVSMSEWLLSPPGLCLLVNFSREMLVNFTAQQTLMDTKFKHRGEDNGYRSIGRDEKVQDLGGFIFVRLFKFSEVVAGALRTQPQMLEGLMVELCRLGNDENRLSLLALSLVYNCAKLKPFTKSESLSALIERLLRLELNTLVTQESFLFMKDAAALISSIPTKTDAMNSFLQQQSWQCMLQLYQEMLAAYQADSSESNGKQAVVLSTFDVLIAGQKELLKYIKITAAFCFCWQLEEQPKPLNIIIKSVQDCMKEERFRLISHVAADAASELCRILLVRNRSVYERFNKSLLEKIGEKYERYELKVELKKNDKRINAEYMESLRLYILNVVKLDPGWLLQFRSVFIGRLAEPDSDKINPNLQILSGTADKLMAICSQQFFQELLGLLKGKLRIKSANLSFLVAILKSLLLESLTNFGKLGGIFIEWLYDCLKQGEFICFEVLETTLNTDIVKVSPICCVFLLRIIKSMTVGQLREVAMRCLPNLLMGAFISTKSLPLEGRLQRKAEKGTVFVRDFKNIKNFEYELLAKGTMQLRSYQMEGIKWMGFLVKYMLSGALCDDMGLGKTLQTLTVVENEYIKQHHKQKNSAPQPSLVICPTTLIEHWIYEYKKYFPQGCLQCVPVYDRSSPVQEQLLEARLKKECLLVTSYSCIEKNTELFDGLPLKFLVLDEGHLIKNTRTKKFQAIRRLHSQHRFILTGTPIQNKLLELWGIFDFLMPGYLQSQEQFRSRYEKLFNVNLMTFKEDDLLFTDEQKSTLEALHLKVMPFILRRLKSEVLKELPEKIIQDYYCQMTVEQQALYRSFHAEARGYDLHKDSFESESNQTIALLTRMRKLLNHPNLVEGKFGYEASGKFLALKQLLEDQGFADGEKSLTAKIIVFSRFNSTLDLIEELLIRPVFPQLSYLKLTGAINNNKRFAVAQEFNDDANIKLLLVTTMVGGYGLNLTSANVVVMFDHDYNPTVDMQAIDRAHRLGQKNVLNVYRLITSGTLEEKIMGIQRFKTNLANAIVNIDNASIKNVKESRLPDLLEKVTNLEKAEPKVAQRLSKSFYSTLIKEMEEAIQHEDYEKQY